MNKINFEEFANIIAEEHEMSLEQANKVIRVMGIMYSHGFQPYVFEDYFGLADYIRKITLGFTEFKMDVIVWLLKDYVNNFARPVYDDEIEDFLFMLELIKHSVS